MFDFIETGKTFLNGILITEAVKPRIKKWGLEPGSGGTRL